MTARASTPVAVSNTKPHAAIQDAPGLAGGVGVAYIAGLTVAQLDRVSAFVPRVGGSNPSGCTAPPTIIGHDQFVGWAGARAFRARPTRASDAPPWVPRVGLPENSVRPTLRSSPAPDRRPSTRGRAAPARGSGRGCRRCRTRRPGARRPESASRRSRATRTSAGRVATAVSVRHAGEKATGRNGLPKMSRMTTGR